MQELANEFTALRDNVASLVALIEDMRKNEARMKHELNELRNENQQQKDQIRFLDEKNKMVNLASAIDPESKADLKVKIKDLVREIDGCIAMIK